MKCVANECNKEVKAEDFVCDEHAKLIINFRRAFSDPNLNISAVLNFGFGQNSIVDVAFTSLSKEIVPYEKIN